MNSKYKNIFNIIKSVTEGETNLIANISNVAAILSSELKHDWIGFYFVDESVQQLVLGPFQGPLACTRIPYGRGVCGDAWKQETPLIVGNVDEYIGHIACSSLSKSEIVIPIIKNKKVLAVLDIDSSDYNTFNHEDQLALVEICEYLSSLF
jgi:GAF domain-containing protein